MRPQSPGMPWIHLLDHAQLDDQDDPLCVLAAAASSRSCLGRVQVFLMLGLLLGRGFQDWGADWASREGMAMRKGYTLDKIGSSSSLSQAHWHHQVQWPAPILRVQLRHELVISG